MEKIQAWARNIQKKRKHREHRSGKGNSSAKTSKKNKRNGENSQQLVRKNSATKIQSAMRGWKERKRHEKRKRR